MMNGTIAILEGIDRILILSNQILEHYQTLTINIIINLMLSTSISIIIYYIKKRIMFDASRIKTEKINNTIKMLKNNALVLHGFAWMVYALCSMLFIIEFIFLIISLCHGFSFPIEGKKLFFIAWIMLPSFFLNITLANNEIEKVHQLEKRREQES